MTDAFDAQVLKLFEATYAGWGDEALLKQAWAASLREASALRGFVNIWTVYRAQGMKLALEGSQQAADDATEVLDAAARTLKGNLT